MRKMLLTPLLVCMVALLSVLSMPVQAVPPITAEGDWTYIPYLIETIKWADGNQFIYGEENGWWDGTFVGTSDDVFWVVKHPSGFVNVKGLISFEGTVSGEEGTLVILFVGKKTWWDQERFWWSGQWVILSGTGDLVNLCGQGTWWGPGWNPAAPGEPGPLEYSGRLHFEPD